MKALDIQHGGNHYKGLAIQPVEYAQANMLPFCEGTVVKYVSRWPDKGGIQDLLKAQHFIDFILEAAPYQQMLARIRGMCLGGAWWRNKITPEQYAQANELPREEACVVRAITNWSNTGSKTFLQEANAWMEELLARAYGEKAEEALSDFMQHCDESVVDLSEQVKAMKFCQATHFKDVDVLLDCLENNTMPMWGEIIVAGGVRQWKPDPDSVLSTPEQFEFNMAAGHFEDWGQIEVVEN